MEKIPFSEANRRLAAQAISLILGHLKFQQNQPIFAVVRPNNPPYFNITYLFMIYFIILLPTTFFF
jgi:hypothetical protein